jgi:hypothetical protein
VLLLLFFVLLQNLTKDDIFKANALGWCIEWVSSGSSSSSSRSSSSSVWHPPTQHWQQQ